MKQRPGPAPGPRWSYAVLESLAAYEHMSIVQFGRRVGISPAQLHRWKHDGLTTSAADRIAIALDRHPAEIWPEWLLVDAA